MLKTLVTGVLFFTGSAFAKPVQCVNIKPLYKPQSNSPFLQKRYQENLRETRDALALLSFSIYQDNPYNLPGNDGVDPNLAMNKREFADGAGFVIDYKITKGIDTSQTSRPSKEVQVIILRGTYTNADWVDNANYFLTSPYPDQQYGLAHTGFYRTAIKMRDELLGSDGNQALLERNPNKPVLIAGHSRGGALSVMLGNLLVRERGITTLGVFPFAAPKIGDKRFTNHVFNRMLIGRIHATQTDGDAAPFTPPDLRVVSLLKKQEGGALFMLKEIGYKFLVTLLEAESKRYVDFPSHYDRIASGDSSDADSCLLAISKLVGYHIFNYGLDFPQTPTSPEEAWKALMEEVDFIDPVENLDSCKIHHTDAYIEQLGLDKKMLCAVK